MQFASSRIWTHVALSISYSDNHYTIGTSYIYIYIYIYIYVKLYCIDMFTVKTILTSDSIFSKVWIQTQFGRIPLRQHNLSAGLFPHHFCGWHLVMRTMIWMYNRCHIYQILFVSLYTSSKRCPFLKFLFLNIEIINNIKAFDAICEFFFVVSIAIAFLHKEQHIYIYVCVYVCAIYLKSIS